MTTTTIGVWLGCDRSVCIEFLLDGTVWLRNGSGDGGTTMAQERQQCKHDDGDSTCGGVVTGYRRSKIDLLKKTNPTSDKNYKARIIVKRDKKLEYMLTSVNTQHNHDVSLSMAKSLKKNRKLSLHVKWIAEINDESSVTMRNTYQSFSNCEWYDMPFVSFVGVNHHGQPVLLGCALLSCEEESSFVWLFDSWIRFQKRYKLDNATFNIIIHCVTVSPIEKQFQTKYTHGMFSELQKKFRATINYIITKDHEEGYIITYKIIKEIEHNDKMFDSMYEVLFDSSTPNVCCQYHLFESKKILCRHSLFVLGLERVKKLPNKYIHDRWKKTLKCKHNSIKCSYDHLEPAKKQYYDMCKQFYNIAEVAATSKEFTKIGVSRNNQLDLYPFKLNVTKLLLIKIRSMDISC
ncbi:protein FAR-RED IMPAIRED RESPONSE 1-like [Arachis ipaensis]|uniref:protein FAR-RED IMPAIRED RESPONSE 1-like n=1 Tax=Arachis ipaensis TaxID=130454 RepID=UPI0007AFA4D1|nr:protein FAR-RED IMPAIRED RESPONSE 1-like [Arachis ipaensis]